MDARPDLSYIDAWRQRQQREAARHAHWRVERRAEAELAARRLGAFEHVTRVCLFGSLARDSARAGSDVDLWVEGLGESDWLAAIEAVRAVIQHAEVDLVRAESASPELVRRVAAEGILLHGR